MKKIFSVLTLLFISFVVFADEALDYSPVANRDYPTQVFWGDTHLHSNNSPDAFTFANTTLTAETAYRFARGEEVKSQFGLPVKLNRPLDFLVVADHAEFLGIFKLLDKKDKNFLATRLGKYWNDTIESGNRQIVIEGFVAAITGKSWDYRVADETSFSVWDEVARLSDQYNDPGIFTTFTAYEWTSMPDGNNLHRVVIFKDSAEKVTQVLPFSAIESRDPEDLWDYLENYEKQTGGEVFAIPHNPNVSNGLLFAPEKLDGSKLDQLYAIRRARWEPILEVTQVKGDSETHPVLAPTDEFADFETWDKANISNNTPKEEWMLKYEYARSALKMGLEYQDKLEANPFKFGMIGSTDNHTSLSTAAESNWFGKFPVERPKPGRATSSLLTTYENWRLSASGYAAVWAEENNRDSLFAAFKRKEVYATTGSRIVLRFFGGWDYLPDDVYSTDFIDIAYKQGVPMGADLPIPATSKAPRFMVVAAKDPAAANLDRVQVIKGWIDADGNAQEKIFDVALSDDRKVDPVSGKIPPVGSSVIVSEASYSNSIGDAELVAYWQDPEFDAGTHAFYYVRVLEIPTPRWTAYDAKRFNLDLPDEIVMRQQERAYSSPIWYSPE